MANTTNDQTRGGLEDFSRSFARYWNIMCHACYDVLRNETLAEEAAGEAVIKALRDLPDTVPTSLAAWLRVVARNTAHDALRKITRECLANEKHDSRVEVPPDQFRVSQIQLDTRLFLTRMAGLLDESTKEDVRLYLAVLFENFTEEELAKELGIPRETLKKRRAKGRKAGREAATVVCLITQAGHGLNHCSGPLDLALARDGKYTPELLRAVKAHIATCRRCQHRQDDKPALIRTIFVIPAAIVLSLLDRLRTSTQARIAAAAVAVMTAAIILIPSITGPDTASPSAPEPFLPTGTKGIAPAPLPTTQPTTTVPTTDGPTVKPTTEPPAALPVTTQPETTATTSSPPDPTGQPRNGTSPTVTDFGIEHDRIAATKNGTCPDKPTSSAVWVTVDREATSVELLVTWQGSTVPQQMTNVGGGLWVGSVGPFLDDARGSVTVTVRVVGTNGVPTTKQLGRICVTRCHRNSRD